MNRIQLGKTRFVDAYSGVVLELNRITILLKADKLFTDAGIS